MFTHTSKHTIILLPQERLLPEISSLMKTPETLVKQAILLNVGQSSKEAIVSFGENTKTRHFILLLGKVPASW